MTERKPITLIFWTKFTKKAKRTNTANELCIFELIQVQNVRLNKNFNFLDIVKAKVNITIEFYTQELP